MTQQEKTETFSGLKGKYKRSQRRIFDELEKNA
jgi:hypothetical protein